MTATGTDRPALDADQQRVLAALLAMQRQSWEQGVASHALLDLGQEGLVEVMARDSVTHQTPSGKLADLNDSGTVNCGSAGEALLWAIERSPDPRLQNGYDLLLQWLLKDCPRADDGTLFHIEDTRECWVDSVYMVVPCLVSAGRLEDAERQFDGHLRRLFDPSAGLYGWRWDENVARMTHPEHWGTGNGWVVAGIARTIRLLEGRKPDFASRAVEHARVVIDACLAHRRGEDGLFHNVIDDPSTFTEANLAQMLAYAILTGVEDGWLSPDHEPVGRSLVASAREQVDEHGFVTQVCGAPHFDHQGTSVEAQSFFLLATAAEQQLTTSRHNPR
ncbi:MAG TPA: glycoside hydrolase family 88 protein [Propionibacteriaceae bacterium]